MKVQTFIFEKSMEFGAFIQLTNQLIKKQIFKNYNTVITFMIDRRTCQIHMAPLNPSRRLFKPLLPECHRNPSHGPPIRKK